MTTETIPAALPPHAMSVTAPVRRAMADVDTGHDIVWAKFFCDCQDFVGTASCKAGASNRLFPGRFGKTCSC